MQLALGILALWLGAALIWVATHGVPSEAPTTPWQVYRRITDGLAGALPSIGGPLQ